MTDDGSSVEHFRPQLLAAGSLCAAAEANAALPHLVVGIGASASSLGSCVELFDCLSPDTGMAFVVVSDADTSDNRWAATIGCHTPMPVAEAVDGAIVRPNSIYVVSRGARIGLQRGAFRIEPCAPGESPRAIDHFFCSLAASWKTRAVGVVLPGTNGDGELGAESIRQEDGVVIVGGPTLSHRRARSPTNCRGLAANFTIGSSSIRPTSRD